MGTLIHRHFDQHMITRPAPSASALEVEDHIVDLSVQTYIETTMDEVVHVTACAINATSVTPTYVNIEGIGAADATTGIRQITVESSTGSGKIAITIKGRRFGEERT